MRRRNPAPPGHRGRVYEGPVVAQADHHEEVLVRVVPVIEQETGGELTDWAPLGYGAEGESYSAVHSVLGPVAVKVSYPCNEEISYHDTDYSVATALVGKDIPGIAKVYGVWEVGVEMESILHTFEGEPVPLPGTRGQRRGGGFPYYVPEDAEARPWGDDGAHEVDVVYLCDMWVLMRELVSEDWEEFRLLRGLTVDELEWALNAASWYGTDFHRVCELGPGWPGHPALEDPGPHHADLQHGAVGLAVPPRPPHALGHHVAHHPLEDTPDPHLELPKMGFGQLLLGYEALLSLGICAGGDIYAVADADEAGNLGWVPGPDGLPEAVAFDLGYSRKRDALTGRFLPPHGTVTGPDRLDPFSPFGWRRPPRVSIRSGPWRWPTE